MTDTTETIETAETRNEDAASAPQSAEQTANAPADAETTVGDAEQGADKSNPNREAAKYRTKLRETEAERDTLAGRLEMMQRAEVARLAGEKLAIGADILDIAGTPLAELLSDEGTVDPDKVTAATDALLESRPNLRRARFTGTADGGPRGGPLEPARPDPIKAAADLIRNGGKSR